MADPHHEEGQACCGACDVAGKTERGEIAFPSSALLIVGEHDTDLSVHTDDGELRKFELRRANQFIVGRKADVKIASAMASSRIFRLEVTAAGEVFVEDVQSACGTYVNGKRAAGRQQICQRDQIQVGGALLHFEQGAAREAAPRGKTFVRAPAPSESTAPAPPR